MTASTFKYRRCNPNTSSCLKVDCGIMHSKIYVGQVNHKRYLPHEHGFSYRMFMMYLDLDELPNLFDRFIFWSAKRFNLAYFNRKLHITFL